MAVRRRQRKPVLLKAGPFRGLRDSLDPLGKRDDRLAYLLQNCYPPDAGGGSAVVGRPGFTQAGIQLGSGGVGQLVYQFTKLDGTEYTVAIVGGQFYTYNWGTNTWTEVVTAANFTTATITLSSTALCYAVTINNKMFVSDGVNTPWTWDGTAGAGGLVKCTACPILFGQPTVYYAAVFGIKATARTTMVWSEVNDPTTGYDTGAFDDSWTLGQTDQESLYALVGTNASLYYFRARSTGVISGAPGNNFRNTGVHDGVSSITGSMSPGATALYEERIYFLDADFLPFAIIPGQGLQALWADVKETVLGTDRTKVGVAVGLYDSDTRLVLLGVVEVGQTIPSLQIVIDPDQSPSQVASLWRGFTFQAMGQVKNSTGQPLLMHLSNDGYAYQHGLEDGSVWSDGLHSGTVAISHVVEPAPMGADVSYEVHYDRLDLNLRTQSDITGVAITQETSAGTFATVTAGNILGGLSRWGFFIWGVDLWSVPSTDQHLAVGLDSIGRWIKPVVRHSVIGEQFGVGLMRVQAIPLDEDPSAL